MTLAQSHELPVWYWRDVNKEVSGFAKHTHFISCLWELNHDTVLYVLFTQWYGICLKDRVASFSKRILILLPSGNFMWVGKNPGRSVYLMGQCSVSLSGGEGWGEGRERGGRGEGRERRGEGEGRGEDEN